MRNYCCLCIFLLIGMFILPLSGSTQLKVYKSNLVALDSSLQHTTGKNERWQILQAMVDKVLVFGVSNTDMNKKLSDKILPEFMLLVKEMDRKRLKAYELFIQYRNYRFSPKPDTRHSLELLQLVITEFDKINKPIPNLILTPRTYYNELNEQEARLEFYDKKVKEYTINNQKQNLAAALHSLGGYYSIKGAHNRAISYYQKAADLFKDFNTGSYCNGISVIGPEYARWGNPSKAIFFVDSAIKISKSAKMPATFYSPLHQAAEVAYILKDYPKSLMYCRELLQISGLAKQTIAVILIRSAICEAKLDKINEAKILIQQGEKIADSINLPLYTTDGYLEIDFAKYLCAFKQHQYSEAIKYLNIALQKTDKVNALYVQKGYLEEFLNFYTVTGSYKDYFLYSKRLDSLNNSIETNLAPLKIANYETEQKENRQTDSLNVLKEEKAIQQAVLNKNKVMLWVSLLGILLISLALYFVYRQSQINKKTLANLQSTQSQLIQSEKMASLGELTAGIAHEIQNPLNFVNNFSEVNTELIDELQQELKTGNTEVAIAISNDIKDNEQKINHHGKRADAIVKGMLQHSRSSSGVKEPTDINALADEYLRLAYHGLRAKDKSFNATLHTDFDENIGKVNIIPQDIGRVILNLITNAFYAVDEKQKAERLTQNAENYQPTVTVSTKKTNGMVEICVADNGNGIPASIKEKIFQPFFTTKPTGQGTGLGLSLSYDIVKAHGGELKVETLSAEATAKAGKEARPDDPVGRGAGTTFIIALPV